MSRLAGPDRPPGPLGLRQHLPRLSTRLNTPRSPCEGPLTPPASPGPEARQGGRSFQGLGRKRLVVFLEPPTERHRKRRILPRLWDGTELTSVSRRLRATREGVAGGGLETTAAGQVATNAVSSFLCLSLSFLLRFMHYLETCCLILKCLGFSRHLPVTEF